jgi:hypothetical protein
MCHLTHVRFLAAATLLLVAAACSGSDSGAPNDSRSTYEMTITAGLGTGTGTVTATGVSCTISNGTASGDCSENVASGTVVTLTATPDVGNTFAAWGGACSGAAGCQVTMTQTLGVSAGFQLVPWLTVSVPATSTTGSYSVTVSCTGPFACGGEFKLQEAPTVAFTSPGEVLVIGASYPKVIAYTGKTAGTYCYRAVPSGLLTWSNAACVAVSPSPTIQLRITNSVSTALILDQVVQVKIAGSESALFTRQDLLSTDKVCRSLPGEGINSGASQSFTVPGGGPDYWVFIGMGTWETDLVSGACPVSSPWFKRTFFFLQPTGAWRWVWRTVHVQGHTSGEYLWTITGSDYANLFINPAGSPAIRFAVTSTDPIP